ncbi:type II toxin-antitoxin system RelE/ParE family toxin [Endozoicomonas arenosclerae]|uniref:type II toxin-antitoxin system RelE/ParE family toxin n=1 Tax=Endozoicomonas arenosclerae TaxID=1633495 RepID=UPI0007812B28|nr:type II toxin-antitoxin system RelE/ParE family toxin [Endozoicomonas arenosclerae]
MEIKWLKKALLNLEAEAEFIAQENPQAAKTTVETIFHSVTLLANNPAQGRPGRIAGIRELVVPGTRYIIPYRVNIRKNRIEVLRVFHTSRKPPTHW